MEYQRNLADARIVSSADPPGDHVATLTGCYSNRGAPSVYGELRTIDKTGTVCRQEDNCFCDFVGCSWTTRRCLRGQPLKTLAHCICAFRASRSRANCIDTDTAGSIFGSPCFRQEIDRGLA